MSPNTPITGTSSEQQQQQQRLMGAKMADLLYVSCASSYVSAHNRNRLQDKKRPKKGAKYFHHQAGVHHFKYCTGRCYLATHREQWQPMYLEGTQFSQRTRMEKQFPLDSCTHKQTSYLRIYKQSSLRKATTDRQITD